MVNSNKGPRFLVFHEYVQRDQEENRFEIAQDNLCLTAIVHLFSEDSKY